MDELLAIIGRKQVELEKSKAAYSKLLKVLAEVVSGDCERSRMLVNLTDETYWWVGPGERPGLPAQINGLPVCVVAPDEQPIEERLKAMVDAANAKLAEAPVVSAEDGSTDPA